MVLEIGRLEPDPRRHEEYRYHLDKYCDTYPHLLDMTHDLVDHEAAKGRTA